MHNNVKKRGSPGFMVGATLIALTLASTPVTVPVIASMQHEMKISSDSYKKQYGSWDMIDIPDEFKMNTIHAATLPTGKVLLVAGSGNNQDNFNKYSNDGQISVLGTAVYDPATNKLKKIDTPADLFCSGHALLQSGKLLIAGGTSGYEKLKGTVTKPSGAMTIHNENPNDKPKLFPKGTKFTDEKGRSYLSSEEFTVNPATKMDHGKGDVMIHHSSTKVFVEAESEDPSYITKENLHYDIGGLAGDDAENIYGQGGLMTLDKQDYRGDEKSYEFDPLTEEYVRVGDLNESRWYASLPVLTNGDVLAVSGLDNTGVITETTEVYNPVTKQWTLGPNKAFPTYPTLFKTQNPDVLFFSGSSSGYGPDDNTRKPGFWNYKLNTFVEVGGLRDQDTLETSASVFLPPTKGSNDASQSYRIMVAGGGGVGESKLATDRVDIIDLAGKNPTFTPGPDLPSKLRYLNTTVTPWDEVFATGGSTDYRAKGNSYSFDAFSFNPTNNQTTKLADELVGRNYHSGSLLLEDGRILVFGGDPLYGDKDNFTAGSFEQRIEVFTPPQFFRGERPAIQNSQDIKASRGETIKLPSTDAGKIKTARLIQPSSTTHVTNIEQRSIATQVTKDGDTLNVALPDDENLLPNGWYMLFFVDGDDRSSKAVMVEITN